MPRKPFEPDSSSRALRPLFSSLGGPWEVWNAVLAAKGFDTENRNAELTPIFSVAWITNLTLLCRKIWTYLLNCPIVDGDSRLYVSLVGTLWFASLARPLGLRSLNVKRSAMSTHRIHKSSSLVSFVISVCSHLRPVTCCCR